jgi:thioredoxin reductase
MVAMRIEKVPGWTGNGPDLVARIEEQATAAGAAVVFEKVIEADLVTSPKWIVTDGATYPRGLSSLRRVPLHCTSAWRARGV